MQSAVFNKGDDGKVNHFYYLFIIHFIGSLHMSIELYIKVCGISLTPVQIRVAMTSSVYTLSHTYHSRSE